MSNKVGVVLVEEEEEVELVDPADAKSTMPLKRAGRFLKPRAASAGDDGGLPLVQPLLREVVARGLVGKWPPEVLFRGWSCPLPQWSEWLRELRPLHEKVWLEAGIHEAVVASTCKLWRDDATMLGLLECWCPETETFVLPWPSAGVEATVTLEDVMVLGGFSVMGEPVGEAPPLAGEAGELLKKLVAEYRSLRGCSRTQRVSQSEWMDHHMQLRGSDGSGSPLEHAAFLSLWLSRFVFPASPVAVIHRSVLPIAARLATGTRVALAPAVLATLYSDLRVMKQRALAEGICGRTGASSIAVWAPFHILQLWAWERFKRLRPEGTPHFLHWDEPRAARWRCSVAKSTSLSTVRSVLASPDEFLWRPYAAIVDDWGRPSHYKHVGKWVTMGAMDHDGLMPLLHCLRACELVDLHCRERYNPHRVAMQFGLDQDLPGRISHADTTWELTWSDYNSGTKKAKFYAPSLFCMPCATKRFFKWQKEWMSARMVEVEKIAIEQGRGQQLDEERKHDFITTECTRNMLPWKASIAAANAGEQPACVGGGTMCTDKLSSTSAEMETQDEGSRKPMTMPKFNSDGESNSGNQSNSRFDASAEDRMEVDSGDSTYELFVTQELEKIDPPCNFETTAEDHVEVDCEHCAYELFITQELEKIDPPCKSKGINKRYLDDALRKERDLAFDREIQLLKAEIAELEERLMILESNTDMENEEV